LSGEKSVEKVWQECVRSWASELSTRGAVKTRFRDDKGKQDQDKVASVEKDVERKRCQGKRLDKQQATGRAVKNQR